MYFTKILEKNEVKDFDKSILSKYNFFMLIHLSNFTNHINKNKLELLEMILDTHYSDILVLIYDKKDLKKYNLKKTLNIFYSAFEKLDEVKPFVGVINLSSIKMLSKSYLKYLDFKLDAKEKNTKKLQDLIQDFTQKIETNNFSWFDSTISVSSILEAIRIIIDFFKK